MDRIIRSLPIDRMGQVKTSIQTGPTMQVQGEKDAWILDKEPSLEGVGIDDEWRRGGKLDNTRGGGKVKYRSEDCQTVWTLEAPGQKCRQTRNESLLQ